MEDYQVSINPPGLSGGFSGQNVISAVANDARSVFAADVDGGRVKAVFGEEPHVLFNTQRLECCVSWV